MTISETLILFKYLSVKRPRFHGNKMTYLESSAVASVYDLKFYLNVVLRSPTPFRLGW